MSTILEKQNIDAEVGDGPVIGHLPISFPSYEIRNKALCGKDLKGRDLGEDVETCVVCLEMARNRLNNGL